MQVNGTKSMSTKSSLAAGPSFHLYLNALEESNIYLELADTHFEAGYNRVLVPIPVHVWEFIRRYPSMNFEYADKSDAELRHEIEMMVDERLKHFHEAGENVNAWSSMSGFFIFGPVDQSREDQIASGITHFANVRLHQRQILQAIADLEKLNRQKE